MEQKENQQKVSCNNATELKQQVSETIKDGYFVTRVERNTRKGIFCYFFLKKRKS